MSKDVKDKYQKFRKAIQMCSKCFGSGGRIAGRAFTDYECESCKKEKSHSNTDTPRVCEPCAQDKNICSYCIGEMD